MGMDNALHVRQELALVLLLWLRAVRVAISCWAVSVLAALTIAESVVILLRVHNV